MTTDQTSSTTSRAHIIIVDDDEAMRVSLAQWLELSDFDVTVYSDARDALGDIAPDFAGVILTDVKMRKMDGITFTKSVLTCDRDIPVIIMTGHGDVPMAVDAMKSGAYDFVEKPFEPKDIVESIIRAIEKRKLVIENRDLRRQIANISSLSNLDGRLIGNSTPMRALKQEIANIAGTEVPVLVAGETGTGKELVARAIHDLSQRRDEKFVAVNCAAIPESTAESELFGHEKGAFTGATGQRIGWIENANKGTLFLDEISSMPLALQAKLLRVIEQREVVRVGSNAPVKVNFRLICATNENLVDAVSARAFREDLLFRINTFELPIAPLRDRTDDITLLFDIFAERAAERFERPYDRPSPALFGQLTKHEWPGNVRELKNLAERYVLLVGAPEERFQRLFKGGFESQGSLSNALALADQVKHFEERLIRDALDRHNGNVKSVMEELDIPRRTLNEKMKKLNIRRDQIA